MSTRAWVVFACIMALSAFLRLWDLPATPPGLYPDEAMNGSNALWALQSRQWKFFYSENNGREGLFINIVGASVAAFGNEPWAVRLPSALFGIATVAGVFFLARELFRTLAGRSYGLNAPEIVALGASFFTAVSFWHLNFSRLGFRAIMAPFFLVWALTLILYAFRAGGRARAVAAALGGGLFGFGFHSYIAYRVAPILLAFPLFSALRNPRLRPTLGIFLAAAFVIALPIGIYFLAHPVDFLGRTAQISVFSADSPMREFAANLARTYGSFWFRGDHNPRHNFPGAAELWWPVGLLFALGLAAGIGNLVRRRDARSHGFLFAWLLLFSLPVALSSEGIPHALRSILMFPPVMIVAGYGLWVALSMSDRWFERREAARPSFAHQLHRVHREVGLLVAVILFAHFATTFSRYFAVWGLRPDTHLAFAGPYAEIGRWLRFAPSSIPKYVIVNAPGVPVPLPDAPEISVAMPAQTIMFLTDTWPLQNQKAKRLFYISPERLSSIDCRARCMILMLEPDSTLNAAIRKAVPNLLFSVSPGFPVFYKGFKLR